MSARLYNVEFSVEELDAIVKGVELWENEPHQSGMLGNIFSAMLGPKEGEDGYEKYKRKTDSLRDEQQRQVDQRKLLSLRLRAKLLEMKARPEEFLSVESSTVPRGSGRR